MKDVKCPYCQGTALLVDSAEVYGKSYGYVYICRPCNAWVGCKKGTDIPLGTLANDQLRAARLLAHQRFDPVWKRAGVSRTEAYRFLATLLNLPAHHAHIGNCNLEQCKTIIAATSNKDLFRQTKPGLSSLEVAWNQRTSTKKD